MPHKRQKKPSEIRHFTVKMVLISIVAIALTGSAIYYWPRPAKPTAVQDDGCFPVRDQTGVHTFCGKIP